MNPRQFLLAVAGGALLPASASAQAPGRVYRIAVISPSEAPVEMIRKLQLPELARVGFVEGRNLTLTTHVGVPVRIPELAREAMAATPDVVIAVSTVAILAVKEASSTVPIVMSSLARQPTKVAAVRSPTRWQEWHRPSRARCESWEGGDGKLTDGGLGPLSASAMDNCTAAGDRYLEIRRHGCKPGGVIVDCMVVAGYVIKVRVLGP
jgi:hypothetical protein